MAFQRRFLPGKTVRSGLTPIGPFETIQEHFQMVVRIGSSGTISYEDFPS